MLQNNIKPSEKKYCPLRNFISCSSECAWYISKRERCAIWVLANSTK